MTCTLLLIRHGETAWNREGRYQGHTDPPLSPVGQGQARRLARLCACFRIHTVFSSDLRRAMDTTVPLAAAHALPVRTDPRLRELDFGVWDGQRAEDVIASDPAIWEAWFADPITLSPPGGETAEVLWDRFHAALGQIVEEHHGKTVAVVTHGGPLRLLLAWLAYGRIHHAPALTIPNGGWLLLTPDLVAHLVPTLNVREAAPSDGAGECQ